MKYSKFNAALLLLFLWFQHGWSQSNSEYILYNQAQLVLENARIVDVINQTTLQGYSILISNGKIEKIEKPDKLQVSDTIPRIDLTNKTIVPGLVMLHEHLMYFSGEGVWDAHPVSYPKLYLAAGVTTIRTAGAENPTYDLNLKRRIDNGGSVGPNIFVTGPMFNDASGGFLGDFVVSNYTDGREAAAFWAAQGCTSFKVYSDISKEALKGIIDEAKSRKLTVTGHLGKISCAEAATLGIDNIEHSFGSCAADLGLLFDGEWNIDVNDDKVLALIDLLIKENVVLTATPFSEADYFNRETRPYLSLDEKNRIDAFLKNRPPWIPRESNEIQLRKLEKHFVAKGGKLVLGADAMDFGLIPGFQNHNVLISMVKNGWDPMDVLKMATIDGATFLNIANDTGSINIGKIADLIIVSGSPDITIEDIKNVELVFHNGIGYNPKTLREAAIGMVGRH